MIFNEIEITENVLFYFEKDNLIDQEDEKV